MIKGPLAILGALVASGGLTGLIHATPKILQSADIICHPVGATFKTKDEVAGNTKIEWQDGTFSGLPWSGDLENGWQKSASCYKR